MKNNYKSIRISQETYNSLRDIQHEKRYNTLKETVEYLIELYKGK